MDDEDLERYMRKIGLWFLNHKKLVIILIILFLVLGSI